MNNLDRWGAELATLLRRRVAAKNELADCDAKIDALCAKIEAEPSASLYGHTTAEQPTVPRNAGPTPYRPDRTDGGNTFRLTPIADTVTLPPVSSCPRTSGGRCDVDGVHVHTAAGVERVADIGR